jgi:hypothetical protein
VIARRALVLVSLAAIPAAAQQRATIVGVVVAKESSQPLSFADVFVEQTKSGGFTNDAGRFRIDNLPAGELRIRVRRLGFSPTTVAVTARDGATDTVRVALTALSLRLERVKVSESVCSNAVANDTAVVAILQQVQLNGERNRLLAREYPFEWTVERVFADDMREGPTLDRVRRRTVLQTDTLTLPSEHEWKYAPGGIIVAGGDTSVGASQKMYVPQLVDFADSSFVAAHCFRFAGLADVDDRRMIRVDLEPARGIRNDVRGSLYLDTASYQIRRSTLFVEQISPRKASDLWEHRVDTWFAEIAPSLPVIDRIDQRTILRDAATRRLLSGQAAVELQRRLTLRFLARKPGEPLDSSPELLVDRFANLGERFLFLRHLPD